MTYKVNSAQAYRGGNPKKSSIDVDKKAGRISIHAGTDNRASADIFVPATTNLGIKFGEGSLKIRGKRGPSG